MLSPPLTGPLASMVPALPAVLLLSALVFLAACNMAAEPPVAVVPAQASPAPPPPRPIDLVSGRATVVAGDVLEVEGQRVRLQAVDAPEARTQHGKRAMIEMRRIVGREPVHCELLELEPPAPKVRPPKVREGRAEAKQGWIGRCTADKIDVAQELVKRGWARALQRYGDSYVIEEASARAAGRGMWPKPPPARAKPATPRPTKRPPG